MVPIDAPALETIFKNSREKDKALVILQHLFFTWRIMKAHKNFAPQIERSSGWVPVLAENLKKLVHNYSEIIQILIRHNIIEFKRNDKGGKNYYPGKLTMLYRVKFGSRITNPEQQRYRQEHIRHPFIINKVKEYYEKDYKNQRSLFLAQNPWFSGNLKFMDQLIIDVSPEELQKYNPDNFYFLWGVQQQFNDKLNRHISIDSFAGRIYSELTSLPKGLRPYLRLKNESSELMIVDIKSSQPYFIGTLFLHYNELLPLIPQFYPIAHKIKKHTNKPDVRIFLEDCINGYFYQRIMDASGLTKDEVKQAMFQHIFYSSASNQHRIQAVKEERLKFRNLFMSIYPSVYKLLVALKRTQKQTLPFVYEISKRKKGKGKMYITTNLIATLLEVIFVINKIAKRLSDDGVPVCLIHDAFIFRKQDLDKFDQIFNEAFHEFKIRPPKLDIQELKGGDNIIKPSISTENR